jgi:thiol-disulfide isomerase/thioredoxin
MYVLLLGISLVLCSNSLIFTFKNEASAFLSAQLPHEFSVKYYESSLKYHGIQFKTDKSEFKKAPEFTEITGYINTKPIKLSDLKGKVVLVHFWTYTCINCIHTIPHLNEWYEKYSQKGLVIVGIQTPEFEFEKNIDSVQKAVKEFEIKYPVIQDNDYGTWNAYGNNYWPRDYLVDKEGYIRYEHIGEGAYNQTENTIQSLITEPGTSAGVNTSYTVVT